MSYKTLEQRFLENSTNIYKQFNNTAALVPEIKPDTREARSRIKDDTRSLPVVSGARDANLLKSFLLSPTGRLFIGKQLLLQTGNTFAETRFFNPISLAANVVPFLHSVRFRGVPLYNFTTPTRDYRGAVQKETIANLQQDSGNLLTRFARRVSGTVSSFGALVAPPRADLTTSYGIGYEFYVRPEDELYSTGVNNDKSNRWVLAPDQTNRRQSLTDKGRKKTYLPYAPDDILNRYTSGILPAVTYAVSATKLTTRVPNFYKGNASSSILRLDVQPTTGEEFVESFTKIPDDNAAINNNDYKVDGKTLTDNIKSFANLNRELNKFANVYFRSRTQTLVVPNGDGVAGLENGSVATGSQLRDPYNTLQYNTITYNIPNTTSTPESTTKLNYEGVFSRPDDEGKSDIIKFIFKADGETPAVFRAFISSLRENVKPEFSEQRYVGRTERFVTYAGVKREASLEFNIVAFSKDELSSMWTRINYLTGLAFPRDVSVSGFMVPPLFKITIGKVYEDQPCYINSLDYDFLDDKITFDIDREVSQVINVKMSLTLLEKTTRFYDSPFYQITQNLLDPPTPQSAQQETAALTTGELARVLSRLPQA